ncbi:hypothetical protein SCORR_v1c09460 [Spiroplasma corruscae]|uniref:Lipoprotein n=1 Tax=Spiroplasma corruscae TaxID=216934 RepID=A0A222EQA2_9MOLU|nr:hypothetical protein [Spiroplasma corruscae]ASP28718.1 hypothetical protein SCORR_v1c09460 [Spiroplasma corruscae]
MKKILKFLSLTLLSTSLLTTTSNVVGCTKVFNLRSGKTTKDVRELITSNVLALVPLYNEPVKMTTSRLAKTYEDTQEVNEAGIKANKLNGTYLKFLDEKIENGANPISIAARQIFTGLDDYVYIEEDTETIHITSSYIFSIRGVVREKEFTLFLSSVVTKYFKESKTTDIIYNQVYEKLYPIKKLKAL